MASLHKNGLLSTTWHHSPILNLFMAVKRPSLYRILIGGHIPTSSKDLASIWALDPQKREKISL
jgi:hypothetical protein